MWLSTSYLTRVDWILTRFYITKTQNFPPVGRGQPLPTPSTNALILISRLTRLKHPSSIYRLTSLDCILTRFDVPKIQNHLHWEGDNLLLHISPLDLLLYFSLNPFRLRSNTILQHQNSNFLPHLSCKRGRNLNISPSARGTTSSHHLISRLPCLKRPFSTSRLITRVDCILTRFYGSNIPNFLYWQGTTSSHTFSQLISSYSPKTPVIYFSLNPFSLHSNTILRHQNSKFPPLGGGQPPTPSPS